MLRRHAKNGIGQDFAGRGPAMGVMGMIGRMGVVRRNVTFLGLACFVVSVPILARGAEFADWPVRAGSEANTRHSTLAKIDRHNVKSLSIAWTYHTGDANEKTAIQCTPIVVAGRMYLTTADGKVVALEHFNLT